jgi:hypothetical protein
MFEQLKKKFGKKPGKGGPSNSDEEMLEKPDADGALAKMDAALAKAERAEQEERRRQEEEEEESMGSSCGCGGSYTSKKRY